jgi:hypothetical protein
MSQWSTDRDGRFQGASELEESNCEGPGVGSPTAGDNKMKSLAGATGVEPATFGVTGRGCRQGVPDRAHVA